MAATAADHETGCRHHQKKSNSGEEQSSREFGGTRQISSALTKSDPDCGEDRGQRDDKNRIDGLEPQRRHFPSEDDSIRVVAREEVEGSRRLLESRPEDRGK